MIRSGVLTPGRISSLNAVTGRLFVDQYAAYVWTAYAITGVGLLGLIGFSLAYTRRWRQRLQALEQAQDNG
jgi:heme exporter protein CcmD